MLDPTVENLRSKAKEAEAEWRGKLAAWDVARQACESLEAQLCAANEQKELSRADIGIAWGRYENARAELLALILGPGSEDVT
jgi:hypothetical protein